MRNLGTAQRGPDAHALFFLARLRAFFSAAVFCGAFFVCFWEFCDLAMEIEFWIEGVNALTAAFTFSCSRRASPWSLAGR